MKDVKKNRQLYTLGLLCRQIRELAGKKQSDIAKDLDLTPQSISLFENGRLDSIYILSWYIEHGLDLSGGMKIWQA